MNTKKIQIKLKIQDLPVEKQFLANSSNISGANSYSESTSYIYSDGSYSYSFSSSSSTSYYFEQLGNKLQFPTFVSYRAAGGYNPWRRR